MSNKAILILISVLINLTTLAKEGWSISAGAALLSSPVFEGDDENGLGVFPSIRIKYANYLDITPPRGARLNVLGRKDIQLGPLLGFHFGREAGDGGNPFLISGETNDLDGLNEIDSTFESGIFFNYNFRPFSLSFEARKGLGGGHNGWISQANLGITKWFGPFMLRPSLSIEYYDQSYNQTFFGISSSESSLSGLSEYTANSGSWNYGAGVFGLTPIFSPVTLSFFWRFKKFGNEIANSSLVRTRGSDTQSTFGVFATYTWK